MRRFNYRQYQIWVKFCRNLFLAKGYVNQQQFNIKAKEVLGINSTHFRKKFIDLGLLSERHLLLFPGNMLYRFKQPDFYFLNKLQTHGEIRFIDDEIHFSPVLNVSIEFPKNWELIENNTEKQIFKILS